MLIFAAAMALSAPADEWLVWPHAEGFIVGHQETAANGSIEEQVPAGETVDDWSRMITRIEIPGDQAAEQFTDNLAARWEHSCPGGQSVSQIALADFRVSIEARMDCPRNPATGKPETMFMRSFRAQHRLYVLQVAFRHAPDAAERAWAEAQLTGATLCDAKSPKPVCKP